MEPALFEIKGGRNIKSNARKRVVEKNDEAIPKMKKKEDPLCFGGGVDHIAVIRYLIKEVTNRGQKRTRCFATWLYLLKGT